MTGSGKTYTMLGDIYRTNTGEKGICSLAVDYLFRRISETKDVKISLKLSYLEIYNEQVKDLLSKNEPRSSSGLMIIEDPAKGVLVPELTERKVSTSGEILSLVLKGNERRVMAATSVNQFSSRSHAILQLMLESTTGDITTIAKLSLVDLAGSECVGKSGTQGIRMIEGGKINKSLLALGNCINILTGNTRAGSFVPYRDSKLTRLLKDSLGGNAKTIMIACISPYYYDETINTLNYADRAKKIKNKVCRHIKERENNIEKYKKVIESLKHEIAELKAQLQSKTDTDDLYFTDNNLPKELIRPTVSENNNKKSKGRSRESHLPSKSSVGLIMLPHELLRRYESQYDLSGSLKKSSVIKNNTPIKNIINNDIIQKRSNLTKSEINTAEFEEREENKYLLNITKRNYITQQDDNKYDKLEYETSRFTNIMKINNCVSENFSSEKSKNPQCKEFTHINSELEDAKKELKAMKEKLKISETKTVKQAEELKEMTKYKELYDDLVKNVNSPNKSAIIVNDLDLSINSSSLSSHRNSDKPTEIFLKPPELIKTGQRNSTPHIVRQVRGWNPHHNEISMTIATADDNEGSRSDVDSLEDLRKSAADRVNYSSSIIALEPSNGKNSQGIENEEAKAIEIKPFDNSHLKNSVIQLKKESKVKSNEHKFEKFMNRSKETPTKFSTKNVIEKKYHRRINTEILGNKIDSGNVSLSITRKVILA